MYLSEHGFRELYCCHGVGMTFLGISHSSVFM